MTNPLLSTADLPCYAAIRPEHVEPAIDQVLADNRVVLERLLVAHDIYTWDNLIQPLEELEDRLNKAWSPANHLHSVRDSEDLRAAYNACLPKLSAYYTELGQHEGLYRAYRQIADGSEYSRLDPAQRKVIDNALRDFRLSGIALPVASRDRYKAIMQELAQLGAKFSENALDATQGWTYHLDDEAQLVGLPESAKALARQTARQRGLDGWLLTLELPSYLPVLNYADDRDLRRTLYDAYCTRASDQGPNAGQWDNGAVMERILALRHEVAQLLGFHDYGDYSLATKMADSPDQVLDFLDDLARRARPQAQRELDELRAFARDRFDIDDLQAWDIGYYSEKLRQHSATSCRRRNCGPTSRSLGCCRGCSRWRNGCSASPSARWTGSKSGIPTFTPMKSSMAPAPGAAGSTWICTPARINAVGRGWTAACREGC